MSLLFFEGFQNFSVSARSDWILSGGAALAGRDGTANGAIRGVQSTRVLIPGAASSTLIFGCAFQVPSLNGSSAVQVRDSTDASTTGISAAVTSTGFIEVRRGLSGTVLGTTSGHNPINVNEWRYIEGKVVLHPTAGRVTLRLDGATVLDVQNVATNATDSLAGTFVVSINNGTMCTDDLYLLDSVDATATQGRPFNDFLGDVAVKASLPNGPGDATQWTPSTAVANWTTVDENPQNTTDYVQTSAAGNRDLYAMEDLPSTAAVAYAVQAIAYAQKTDAGAAAVKPIVKDGSVVSDGGKAAQPLSTTYATYGSGIITKKPSDGTLLTVAAVNAMQAGVESG